MCICIYLCREKNAEDKSVLAKVRFDTSENERGVASGKLENHFIEAKTRCLEFG